MSYVVAVVGATGMVGRKMLQVLEEKKFPVKEIKLLASARSAGKKMTFRGKEVVVEELKAESFVGVDVALFSAGGETSKKFAPEAAERGAIVVDNSSAWRMTEDVPLVVPEVNPEAIKNSKIIANPNCSTTQCVLPLKVVQDLFGLKRVVYSTYQAVSGSGRDGIEELKEGKRFYPYQIKNNCLPHIDVFLDNGYTKEEEKMINETRKILEVPELPITATCVRVPVLNCHGVSINVETESEVDIQKLRDALQDFPGVVLYDDPKNNVYPLASESDEKNEVFVGRLRKDPSIKNGLNMWVVSDNLRKGAATNTVQIAEVLAKGGKL
ncbi:aspartate-semialdehyde dehydrogenase [Ilyobacter polytropus]|uniref:Aspartate-semialdehyde dehydrogenase n=1 Tax=Ilyobacter polytropus (strain ATCC 51220 / DSM 2926 / LMG 16218 / CuHBu1) TaxID=572544 RepID=E3H6T3_ILYPC|nr:aspartate-semialdehyde dehydrogenase [Ilyobacter polytropus]ADO82452.1 aspartate semialdehyde dehydrogenase [Ilyobacter polytropus DSM 2926]